MTMSKCPTARTSGEITQNFFRRTFESLLCNPNAVIALFGLYYLIQIFVRLAMPPALRIDEAQQVLFAQWLALGYDAQPPLYNWFQQAIFELFGTSLATLAIAKNLVLFLTFAIYIRTADLVLKDKRLVLVSALALFVIPQVFWQAQRDLTHTTMLMLTCTWVVYLSVRLIQKPTTSGYVLMGIAVGLGMLSKYNFVLILPAVLAAVWFHPQGRARILDRRFLLTVAISFIVFLPHAFWLLENLNFASDVTLRRMAEEAPDSRPLQILLGLARVIFGSVMIVAIPSLLVLASSRRRSIDKKNTADRFVWFRFFLHYFVGLAVVLFIIIVSTTMTEVRDRWLLPLLMPFPILAALWLERVSLNHRRFTGRILPALLTLMAVLPLALIVSVPLQAWTGKASRSNNDWESFRRHIHDEKGLSPSVIITPDWHTGGNLRFVFDKTPVATVIYDDFDPKFQPSYDHPILFAWTGDGDATGKLTEWLKEQIDVTLINVTINRFKAPMYFAIDGKIQTFSYVVITPANFRAAAPNN